MSQHQTDVEGRSSDTANPIRELPASGQNAGSTASPDPSRQHGTPPENGTKGGLGVRASSTTRFGPVNKISAAFRVQLLRSAPTWPMQRHKRRNPSA